MDKDLYEHLTISEEETDRTYSLTFSNDAVMSSAPKTGGSKFDERNVEENFHQPRLSKKSDEHTTVTPTHESESNSDGQGSSLEMNEDEPTVNLGISDLDTEEGAQSRPKGKRHQNEEQEGVYLKDSILTDSLDYCAPAVRTGTSTYHTLREDGFVKGNPDILAEKAIKLNDNKLGLLQTFQKQFALFLREEYIYLDVCLHDIRGSTLVLKGHREHLEHDDFIQKFLIKCIQKVTQPMKELEIQLLSNTTARNYINQRLGDLQLVCFWACGEDGMSVDVFSQKDTVAMDAALLISQCLCKWSITLNDQENSDVTKEVISKAIEKQYKNKFIWQELKVSGNETDEVSCQFNFVSLDTVMPDIKTRIKNALHSCSTPHRAQMICRPAESNDRDFFTGLAQRFCSTVGVKEGFIEKTRQVLTDRHCFLLADSRRILIQQGSLCDSDADVILCPVDDMHNAVGVGEMVFEKIGDDLIQDIFKQLWKVLQRRATLVDKNHPHFTDSVCRNLETRYIMFAVLPVGKESDTDINATIIKALSCLLDESDKHACSSVAISVDYTPTISTHELLEAFTKSLKIFNKKLKFVKELRLVVSSEDCVTSLKEQLSECKDVVLPKPRSLHVFDLTNCQVTGIFRAKNAISPIDIGIFQGNLTHPDLVKNVDMLVNSVGCKGDVMRGAISKTIIKEGGHKIREEFDDNMNEGLRFGETILTGAGNLQCKKICHVLLYNKWDTTGDFSLKVMRSVIIKTLLQAENEHCVSLGIPAFGTGFLGYPVKPVVNALYNTIETYGRCHSTTCIRRVLLAVMDHDELYKEALCDVLSYQKARQLHRGIQFYNKNVGMNPGLDTRFHFWEMVDRSTGVVVRVAPDFPLGVYFDIDIVYTLKETSSSLSQERIIPKAKFDRSDNIYKIDVDTPRFRDQVDGISKTLKDCMKHAKTHKFMSLAFQVQTSAHDEICKICMLISKLISKITNRGDVSVKYSILVNSDVDIKNITGFQGCQLHFRRKCRYTDQYMEKGILVSMKSKSRSTYDKIRHEIENHVDVIAISS